MMVIVYVCNKKKCNNGACELCHHTTDIRYAELDENGEPIIARKYDSVTYEEVEK